jgi:hypothetical protein
LLWLIVLIEAVIGQCLILNIASGWMFGISIVLLVGFSGHIGYLLTMSEPPSCGCGLLIMKFRDAQTALWYGLVRNGVLIAAAGTGALLMRGSVGQGHPA